LNYLYTESGNDKLFLYEGLNNQKIQELHFKKTFSVGQNIKKKILHITNYKSRNYFLNYLRISWLVVGWLLEACESLRTA